MGKITFYLVIINLTVLFSIAFGQCDTNRYQNAIFSSVTVHKDIKYGSAPVWSIPYNNTDLLMDIYTPNDDTLTARPLMIWVHPGGFLNGSKEADDMVALCDSFAKRGYVTASIDYRLGFNPTSESSAERAVYRGVQDARAAIRYLKEKYETYGIDTNYTFIGGSSAGGFSTTHVVYLDQDEMYSSINAGLGYPALGCLDCTGNDYNHNMDITGYVSLWGAIGDSTWIQADETTPGLLVHGTSDGTVPFGIGHPFGVPTMPKTQGSRPIHNQLNHLGIPHEYYFVEGEGHEFHGASNGDFNSPPTPYWDTIFALVNNHYATLLKGEVFEIEGPQLVCQKDTITYSISAPNGHSFCWNISNGEIVEENNSEIKVVVENELAVITIQQFTEIGRYNGETTFEIETHPISTVNFNYQIDELTVKFNPLPDEFSHYSWSFGDGNNSDLKNPTHVYQHEGTYLVKLSVINQEGCISTIEKEINVGTTGIAEITVKDFQVYPNPATDEITLEMTENYTGKILLIDALGRVVKTKEILHHAQEVTLNIQNISKGMYWIHIGEDWKVEKIQIQ